MSISPLVFKTEVEGLVTFAADALVSDLAKLLPEELSQGFLLFSVKTGSRISPLPSFWSLCSLALKAQGHKEADRLINRIPVSVILTHRFILLLNFLLQLHLPVMVL